MENRHEKLMVCQLYWLKHNKMTNLEQARWIVKAFRQLIHETTLWATSGDERAALDLMSQIATRNLLLKGLGFALTDKENLVVYRPPVGIEKRKNYLALRAVSGDSESAKELLKLMSK